MAKGAFNAPSGYLQLSVQRSLVGPADWHTCGRRACQVSSWKHAPAASADLALGHGLGCLLLMSEVTSPLLQLRPTFWVRDPPNDKREQYPIPPELLTPVISVFKRFLLEQQRTSL